jgi:hypothetical protein
MIGSFGWDGKLSVPFARYCARKILRAIASESDELEEAMCEGLEEAYDFSNFFILCHYELAVRSIRAAGRDAGGFGDFWDEEYMNS